jgi:hypothetical protein
MVQPSRPAGPDVSLAAAASASRVTPPNEAITFDASMGRHKTLSLGERAN